MKIKYKNGSTYMIEVSTHELLTILYGNLGYEAKRDKEKGLQNFDSEKDRNICDKFDDITYLINGGLSKNIQAVKKSISLMQEKVERIESHSEKMQGKMRSKPDEKN